MTPLRRLIAGSMAVAALSSLGCEPLTAPRALLPGDLPDLSNGVVMSATGGGIVDLSSAAVTVGNESFAFSAVLKGDGSAGGQFHSAREADGHLIAFSGDVTCLYVDAANHRAWIGGIITENSSTHPLFLTNVHEVGDDVWFRVVDYGESANDATDRSTVYGFAGAAGILTSVDYCTQRPWPAADARTFPLGAGNIQVKP